MKILLVDVLSAGCAGSNLFYGGSEMHNYLLCKVLDSMGHEVHVIQTTYGDMTEEECSYHLENVTQHFLGASRESFISTQPKTNSKDLKNLRTSWGRKIFSAFEDKARRLGDIDFAFNNYRARYTVCLCGMGIPTIQPTHWSTHQCGGLPGSVSKFIGAPEKCASDIFKFGYISEYVKNNYMSYSDRYLPFKITEDYMTPYYVGLSSFRGEILGEHNYLQMITRSSQDKAPHVALEIAEKHGIDLHFYTNIHEEKYYEDKIKRYENHPHIKIIVGEKHDTIMESLKRSRGLVMTSQRETFGIVGLEAMERGVPILYLDNKEGTPPQDAIVPPALKEKIQKSLTLEDLAHKMQNITMTLEERREIAEEVRTYFSIETWQENLNRIFSEMKKSTKAKKTALF